MHLKSLQRDDTVTMYTCTGRGRGAENISTMLKWAAEFLGKLERGYENFMKYL